MDQQLLIADADHQLSDLYQKYFTARGYSVRIASGGVECLKALRDTPPDVLVLDAELKWGGADGVLAVMDEEDGLSTIPVVLLNDVDARDADFRHPSMRLSSITDDAISLKWPALAALSSQAGNPGNGSAASRIVDHLPKPFRLQNLLDSISTAPARFALFQ